MIPATKAPTNATDWTVGELSGALKRTLEDAFGHVRVRGEIFGYKGQHGSGHAYFCLKDQDAKIEAVVWRTAFARMRVKPKEGLEVVATGRVTTFPNKSTYQIVIESLEPAGVGAWMALLEERRRALAAEGLFAEARKRALPFLPVTIGVVTSTSGAVIRDILHRLDDRFPRHVLVWPVRVQGETCAAEVAAAIRGFNDLEPGGAIPRPDVIVLARGGGSIEDLWGFNEEIVVRAAAESVIPLVSAIGHETDTTLVDLAADRRAPTPTGAAEMIVPVRSDLLNHLDKLTRRHHAAMRREVETRRAELRSAARALPRADSLVAQGRQRLDEGTRGLERGFRDHRQGLAARLAVAGHRLAGVSPAARLLVRRSKVEAFAKRPKEAVDRLLAGMRRDLRGVEQRLDAARESTATRLAQGSERVAAAAGRLDAAWTRQRERKAERLAALDQLFGSLNYRAVLARGYAIVRDETGALVRSADEARTAQTLAIEFAEGRVTAAVECARPAPPARRKAEPRRAVQGTLFDA